MPFLDRFTHSGHATSDDPLVSSVLDNLNHILNTKRLYGSALPNFGIDDLSHCTSRDALIQKLMDQVSEAITTFESRIELVEIIPRTDNASMRVSLSLVCRIKDSKREFDLSFDTTGSRVRVRE